MAMFEITVHNTQTGVNAKYQADLYSLQTEIDGEDGVLSAIEGAASVQQQVRLLLAQDEARHELFENPVVKLLYAVREEVFEDTGRIDVSELRRQMENMGG